MNSRKLLPFLVVILLSAFFAGAYPAAADSSHARIIRLSLVQGDVRFARDFHGDPLADSKAAWETAELNLPIRQGYVLATDNGRAEVEFENGAMAFLKENTVLEFYDLTLRDGARTTRLVLRQGSASFYVNPARDDYFSVTGGDFTVEASDRSSFRLDNYDDGSTVETLKGHVAVLHKDSTTRLEKGQSLSMKAGDEGSLSVGRVPEEDEFDHWVSGRIDTVSTATAAALQYSSSPSYAPGFGSLYSYGSWFGCGGYGYGWRPFGAGFGWSPFTDGQWIFDPTFGWTWDSFQPWGWAPYHYGGWLFDSGCGGWFYSPPLLYGFYSGVPRRRFLPVVHPPRVIYHPVTAVFVRNKGIVGIVPMHPLDAKGKTPLNLERGVFSTAGSKDVSEQVIAGAQGQKWKTLKSAPKDAFSNSLASTASPVRVSRTLPQSTSGARAVILGHDSSITYDTQEHRFVNANGGAASAPVSETAKAGSESGQSGIKASEHANNSAAASGTPSPAVASSSRTPVAPPAARSMTPPPRARTIVPPPAPSRGYSSERGSSGGRSSGGSSTPHSNGSGWGHSSSSPAPSSHASSGASGHPH
jgi:uncharacterized protein DUF6600/FecR-like protein